MQTQHIVDHPLLQNLDLLPTTRRLCTAATIFPEQEPEVEVHDEYIVDEGEDSSTGKRSLSTLKLS